MRTNRCQQSGAATVEFALTYVGIIIPVTFAIVFTAQLLWVWHSAIEWTREGARYASTHCWQPEGSNVAAYMKQNVPVNIDQDQFVNGPAVITVSYYSHDPASGAYIDFTCTGSCSTACVPDLVIVSVTGYQFTKFLNYLHMNPIVMPDFTTTVPVESAGCNPEDGSCSP
jgi:hypothetical protein